MTDKKAPRPPQTPPMAVGSAFDARVKSYLYDLLIGDKNPEYDFNTLFERQVEPQNRDKVLHAGLYLFKKYKDQGALADLIVELKKADAAPRFETTIRAEIGGVPLLGKPDVYFRVKNIPIILDWKCNGYYSKASPAPGFVRLLDDHGPRQAHKKAFPYDYKGWKVSTMRLHESKPDWARQLTVYGWCLGIEPGDNILACIDQLACKSGGGDPYVRVAQHRSVIDSAYQSVLLRNVQYIWECINSDHVFRDLSLEESKAKERTIKMKAEALAEDPLFSSLARGGNAYFGK